MGISETFELKIHFKECKKCQGKQATIIVRPKCEVC